MSLNIYLIYPLTVILLFIVVLKTVLFFLNSTNRRVQHWFFFSNYSIYNSRTNKSKKLKVLQNRLTVLAIALLLIDIALYLLFQ